MAIAFQKHPAAIAWDRWIESKEGRKSREPYDFTPTGHAQYLENRLALAFQAGYVAAEIAKRSATPEPQ
jgi:hypothetical protein